LRYCLSEQYVTRRKTNAHAYLSPQLRAFFRALFVATQFGAAAAFVPKSFAAWFRANASETSENDSLLRLALDMTMEYA
jgi:hypothetical protein